MSEQWRKRQAKIWEQKEKDKLQFEELRSIAEELGFLTEEDSNLELDFKFFHRLFKMLKEQQERIEELERRIK